METLLLVVIAVFLPPLAVFLVSGLSSTFWINLVLTLIFYFPGLLHALYVIFTRSGAHTTRPA